MVMMMVVVMVVVMLVMVMVIMMMVVITASTLKAHYMHYLMDFPKEPHEASTIIISFIYKEIKYRGIKQIASEWWSLL